MPAPSSPLSYTDALRVLGGHESPAAAFADRIAEGALALLGLPALDGLRALVVEHGRAQVSRLAEKLTGLGRLDRSQRLAAAHAIIVVEAYFETLAEELPAAEDPRVTGGESVALATGEPVADSRAALLQQLATAPVPLPSPTRSPKDNTAAVHRYFDTVLATATRRFVQGLAVLDRGDTTHVEAVLDRVPDRATARYAESYRRLVAEHAEFAAWNAGVEHAATRHRVDTGLAELGRLLSQMSVGATPDERRAALAARHRAVLARPILDTPEVPDGFVLPTLERSYVNPRARVGRATRAVQPGSRRWAKKSPIREDVPTVLAGELTRPDAVDRPLILLGHPGSGKSLLTHILAARLPAEDFLPIRVALRDVPADAPVQEQIERGVHEAIGDHLSWAEVARAAGGALPVVLLDGFDELVQAGGKDQADYLERVREFQRREAELGRPLAVMVTSRTVAGDRVRVPERCTVIHLEPFTDDQIQRALAVWNDANATARPLTLEHLAPVRELAEQPLMLQMLMLYDVDGAALRAGTELSRSGLYTELLTAFAEREVRRTRPGLIPDEITRAVDEELRQLEVAALGMFLRQSQRVTAEQLDTDLTALLPDTPSAPGAAARDVLGRFFFVNASHALEHHHHRLVYEFLHATFGEFLVARAVVGAVEDLLFERELAARRRYAQPLDDGLLYALCSFGTLARSAAVVDFVDDLFQQRFEDAPDRRAGCRDLLVDLFRAASFPNPARSFAQYEPNRLSVVSRQARYTANLVCLLVVVWPEPTEIAELCGDDEEPATAWRAQAGQWLDLSWGAWHGILNTVRTRHRRQDDGAMVSTVERERLDPVNVGECVALELRIKARLDVTDAFELEVPADGTTGRHLRSAALRVNGTAARPALTLLPYLRHVSPLLTEWFDTPSDRSVGWSQTHDLLELRLAPPDHHPRGRLNRYRRLLRTRALGRIELLVLRQVVEDLTLLRNKTTRDEYRTTVLGLVRDFLSGVEDVVTGPALAPAQVLPVLDSLAAHDDSVGVSLDDVVGDVRDLVRATAWPPPTEPAPAPAPRPDPDSSGAARSEATPATAPSVEPTATFTSRRGSPHSSG